SVRRLGPGQQRHTGLEQHRPHQTHEEPKHVNGCLHVPPLDKKHEWVCRSLHYGTLLGWRRRSPCVLPCIHCGLTWEWLLAFTAQEIWPIVEKLGALSSVCSECSREKSTHKMCAESAPSIGSTGDNQLPPTHAPHLRNW